MRDHQFGFDEFPTSPYVAELKRGVSARPFSPEIEAEYRQVHLDRVHLRTRVWYSWSVLIGLELSGEYVREHGLRDIYDVGLLLLVNVPAMAMFLLVWTRWYRRYFTKSTVLIALAFCSTIVVIAHTISAGHGEAATGLAVNVFALHFLAGLGFRAALLIDTAMLLTFLLAASAAHLSVSMLLYGIAVLVIATSVISVVQRDVEVFYRRGFLEHCVIMAMASRDGLTGLMNRRALDDHLHRVWRLASRDRHPIAVVLIDIDHFKNFNDELGHQAGDAALREVARIIADCTRRPLDLAARYGGDEFAVILYGADASGITAFCEQIRRNIEVSNGNQLLRAPVAVTVSIGAGVLEPDSMPGTNEAIQFADEALYAAKRAGRNRVVVRTAEFSAQCAQACSEAAG